MAVQDRFKKFVPDQREFFDTLIVEDWPTYDSEDWDVSRRFEVDQLFQRVRPSRILDVGCGCGFHDVEMAKPDFVKEVHAFDYSVKSVERAEISYPHPKVTRFVADISTYSPKEPFDLVVSFQVFEHLEDTDAYFDMCKRAAKKGGDIVIYTPNRYRLRNRILQFKNKPLEILDPQHFREYTATDLKKLGASAGLTPVGHFGHGLYGLDFINNKPMKDRLQLGARFPFIANGIAVLFRNP